MDAIVIQIQHLRRDVKIFTKYIEDMWMTYAKMKMIFQICCMILPRHIKIQDPRIKCHILEQKIDPLVNANQWGY